MSYNKRFTKKTKKKMNFFFCLLILLLLSTLEINHCSQNDSHHRFTKLIDNFRIRILCKLSIKARPLASKYLAWKEAGNYRQYSMRQLSVLKEWSVIL